MEISQALLGLMFSISVCVGMLHGFIWDVFGFVRVLMLGVKSESDTRTSKIIRAITVFTQDVLFCVICAVSLLLLLYYTNDGQFRGLAVIGIAAGFFVYRNTLGRLFMRLFDRLAALVRTLATLVGRTLLLPIKLLVRLYGATLGRVACAVGAKFKKIRDEKYTARIIELYRARASKGFDIAVLDKDTDRKI